ncbi:MAG: HD domain-containing protein, partial [Sulfurimonas sp.]|nr:HD domain-containing protein [Sulfurimonas sp.]
TEMWKSIQNKKVWHGSLKNRIKNGGSYTVDATILPIVDINDNIVEYIAIRHDITELENYKELLKNQLVDTSKSLSHTINYMSQYEEAINNSVAILKTDTQNIITFANNQFCKISGYSIEELVGLNCETLRSEKHIKNDDCKKISYKLSKGEIATFLFTNVDKNDKRYTIDTIIYPVSNVDGEIIEHLHVMHDITEIINLSKEIEETQREVVFRMGAIGETRSKETGNHVKRVAEYSKLLGILHGLSSEEAELLKQASPMHDIGKVGIPDAVLNKPGSLNPQEWKVMQTHAQLGYEMLKHSQRPILKAAATVANEHHEKWDGSGYPSGLKKENIHLYGRITAVADVFDALGSDRCYKRAWPLEKILKMFKEESGIHFDPKLIELFLNNLDQFLAIRDKFKD